MPPSFVSESILLIKASPLYDDLTFIDLENLVIFFVFFNCLYSLLSKLCFGSRIFQIEWIVSNILLIVSLLFSGRDLQFVASDIPYIEESPTKAAIDTTISIYSHSIKSNLGKFYCSTNDIKVHNYSVMTKYLLRSL